MALRVPRRRSRSDSRIACGSAVRGEAVNCFTLAARQWHLVRCIRQCHPAVEIKIFVYRLIFHEPGQTDLMHLGNGGTQKGPTTTSEHETWHTDGMPEDVRKDIEKRTKKILKGVDGYHKGAKAEMERIWKEVEKARQQSKRFGLSDEEACKASMKYFMKAVKESWHNIVEAGAWHDRPTDGNSDYDLTYEKKK